MNQRQETYGTRLRQFERREQMTTWVAAGIASLVVFIGAGALAASPPLFSKVIFTLSILGGTALALARVQFEWAKTEIKRKIEDVPTVKDTPLADDEAAWPRTPEIMWDVARSTIVAGWSLMILGIWWPLLAGGGPPRAASDVRLSLDLTGTGPDVQCPREYKIGPLKDGATDRVESGNESFDDQIARIARDLGSTRQKRRLVALLLVGSADKRPLRPPLAQKFGSNVGLAQVRAKTVRERLETQLGPAPPTVLVLSAGPSLVIMKQNGNDSQFRETLGTDRHVQVCAVWGT
jgi:hypothetical protein